MSDPQSGLWTEAGTKLGKEQLNEDKLRKTKTFEGGGLWETQDVRRTNTRNCPGFQVLSWSRSPVIRDQFVSSADHESPGETGFGGTLIRTVFGPRGPQGPSRVEAYSFQLKPQQSPQSAARNQDLQTDSEQKT